MRQSLHDLPDPFAVPLFLAGDALQRIARKAVVRGRGKPVERQRRRLFAASEQWQQMCKCVSSAGVQGSLGRWARGIMPQPGPY